MKTKDYSGIKNNGKLPDPHQLDVPTDIGDLLTDYIESASSMLEELEAVTLEYEAGRNRDENAAKIRRILHKIKGESGMVGIEDMSEFCHQVEDAFELLPPQSKPDMLLRFKDWAATGLANLKTN